ncbi:exopolysaccharide biosynthesis protein [Roseomonas sp. NAR14]|uniref:Exopolysaccharide biosynthesis protein n=1 Tax=Roseomonas acroporae TaxID=2937791 RepID=A0A9X1Y6P2_9PROT|nr:exopolysaccharide biosynthesis protein [Roseomonas acroporae]MCK8784563.1 exopolysaccharide biosynthesis protein [Roseomonas acroporae]
MHGSFDSVRVPPPPEAKAFPGAGPTKAERPPPDSACSAPISRLVAEVVARCPGERITLGEIASVFGDRAFGLLILLFCLPSLLPGMACVFGFPMLLLGVQMGLGWRRPHLPRFLAERRIRREDLLRLASSSSAWIARVERYVRPRPGIFISPWGDRVFGWLTAYVALMLILPGPGTNGPPAFGNIVMALGLVEHDNKVMGWGVALTVLGCLFATVVLLALLWFGAAILHWLF